MHKPLGSLRGSATPAHTRRQRRHRQKPAIAARCRQDRGGRAANSQLASALPRSHGARQRKRSRRLSSPAPRNPAPSELLPFPHSMDSGSQTPQVVHAAPEMPRISARVSPSPSSFPTLELCDSLLRFLTLHKNDEAPITS